MEGLQWGAERHLDGNTGGEGRLQPSQYSRGGGVRGLHVLHQPAVTYNNSHRTHTHMQACEHIDCLSQAAQHTPDVHCEEKGRGFEFKSGVSPVDTVS